MNHTNNSATTQRILLGLVAVSAVVDPAAATEAAIKLAQEERARHQALAHEAKQKKNQVQHTQPKNAVSHERMHKHRPTGASKKRY